MTVRPSEPDVAAEVAGPRGASRGNLGSRLPGLALSTPPSGAHPQDRRERVASRSIWHRSTGGAGCSGAGDRDQPPRLSQAHARRLPRGESPWGGYTMWSLCSLPASPTTPLGGWPSTQAGDQEDVALASHHASSLWGWRPPLMTPTAVLSLLKATQSLCVPTGPAASPGSGLPRPPS